jgi:hypothetical protein
MLKAALTCLVLTLAGCAGAGGSTTTVTGAGAESAVAAVQQLRSSLQAGEFATTGALTIPGQAALASLADEASIGEVAQAIDEGDAAIAASFWEGFAQGAGESFAGDVAIDERGTTTEDGIEFFLVGVTPGSGVEQTIVTRESDGQRIDLFASFGAGLAAEMMSPVEILLGTSSEDAATVLAALQDVVPSLLVAASNESLSPDASQRVLQLVELITRVG